MATPSNTSSTLARDLLFNPVRCQASPHQAPAVLIYEAVVSDRYTDTGRMYWLVCDDVHCLSEIQQQADSYNPCLTDLRDATAAELEEISGLDVTGKFAGAA